MPINNTITIKVAVGSSNPCKVDATKKAFESVFCRESSGESNHCGDDKNYEVDIVMLSGNVESNVNDQPMGDEETKRGALNRAKNILSKFPQCDFAVGRCSVACNFHNCMHDMSSYSYSQ